MHRGWSALEKGVAGVEGGGCVVCEGGWGVGGCRVQKERGGRTFKEGRKVGGSEGRKKKIKWGRVGSGQSGGVGKGAIGAGRKRTQLLITEGRGNDQL